MQTITRSVALAASVALAMVAASPAHAQDESLNRARDAFDAAQVLYEAQKYPEAAAKFQEAYAARPFAQFLFNIGACFEKAGDLAKAIENYNLYVEKDPDAKDAEDVKKRVAALDEELKKRAANPDTAASTQPVEMTGLGEITLRGLVVIESEPAGAKIYLDDKKSEPLATTPWNGALEGNHTIFIEKEGYKSGEKTIQPDPNKLLVLFFGLSEQEYLGWVKIESNIPQADIYIDDKSTGVSQKTPWRGQLEPGKHKIWVTKPGYSEYFVEVDVVRGETHDVRAELEGSEVGYLNIRGNVEHVKVELDGEVLCERGACRKPIPEGKHKLVIKRSGYKSYTKQIYVQPATEMTIKPRLAKKPGRVDAIVAYVIAGGFAVGGYMLHSEATGIRDEIQADVDAGTPPPDRNDERFDRARLFSIAGDSLYGLGALSLATAIYYTFRDKGAPSTAKSEVQSLSLNPQAGPGYAGLGMEMSW